ncbi:methyl-CpG-binding domain protein 2 isoform X1 [Caretta caretta]|uniref:methyl-CpG-binding domain protein 2 isoform X1 n=1 Tax=Caretta caretta TaxID=8467 RepID=UPI003F4B4694
MTAGSKAQLRKRPPGEEAAARAARAPDAEESAAVAIARGSRPRPCPGTIAPLPRGPAPLPRRAPGPVHGETGEDGLPRAAPGLEEGGGDPQVGPQRRQERCLLLQGKPDLNTTLPIRQTASIFKQPVTKVTNHPSNKVRSDPQRVTEQPRQLFWEKRLQGLSASDVSEQIIKSMELPKGLQGVGPGNNDETLLSAVASALHTSSAPITGQLSAAVEKNPAVWLNTSQPLCKAFIVTDEDIRKQEERVQQVRKKLEEALMADILSRAADTTKDTDVEMDNGDDA